MEINKTLNGTELTIELSGRLDTRTAPQLESEMKRSLNGVSLLVFDLNNLEYVSSAGLRIFLMSQKVMNKQGRMIVKNVKDVIMDIFEVTGFVDILTIE